MRCAARAWRPASPCSSPPGWLPGSPASNCEALRSISPRSRASSAPGDPFLQPDGTRVSPASPGGSCWRLIDIFVVLLTATVAWRMLGVRGGVIALIAGLFTYQEIGAPAWLWLAVLVALALQRAAPEGRLRAWAAGARVLILVLLLLVLVPFGF